MSNSFHQYRDDVPSAIAQKLGLLREQEKRIISMEKELEILQGHHAALEAELAPYRKVTTTLIGPNDTDCPINRLPNELIELTFEYFIKSKHRAIITLLFVCKRWHSVVISSPRLWARIEITNAFELFDLPFQKSAESYITKCLELSAGLPLHAHLDLRNLPSCSGYIGEFVDNTAYHVIDPDQHSEELFDALYNLDWDKYNAPTYRVALDRAFKMLVGVSSQNIRRWKSLWIWPSSNPEIQAEALIVFGQGEANLTSLAVINEYGEKHQGMFGNMFTIEHLTIQIQMPLSSLKLSETTLQSLNIRTQKIPNLWELSKFTLLHTLSIEALHDVHFVKAEESPSFPINLPKLHTLSIVDRYWRLAEINWILPSMRHYRLDYTVTRPYQTKIKLPQISAPNLVLEHQNGTGYGKRESEHLNILDTFFSLSPEVETLTVQHDGQGVSATLRAIANAKRQGRLRRLKLLTAKRRYGPQRYMIHMPLVTESFNVTNVEEVDTLIVDVKDRDRREKREREETEALAEREDRERREAEALAEREASRDSESSGEEEEEASSDSESSEEGSDT